MSFLVSKTPTLQAVATEDGAQFAEDLKERVDAAIRTAQEQPEVIAAVEAHTLAEAEQRKLEKAERALNQLAKQMLNRITALREGAVEGLINSIANEEKPDFGKITELSASEERNRQLSRAIERLVEHRIPLARIERLRTGAHAAATRARALENIAQERAEKVLENLREAVHDELVLPVDLSKGVSGVVLAQAAEWHNLAAQVSAEADRLEKVYSNRV